MNKQIEPSLLAFNYEDIQSELDNLKQLGIKTIHYDFISKDYNIDGCQYYLDYIPTLIRNGFAINVHIMSLKPESYINDFVQFKINGLTFQQEVMNEDDCKLQLEIIKLHGIKAGLAFKPLVEISQYDDLLRLCDIVTIMSVEPGKGGQSFIEDSLRNLQYVYEFRQKNNLQYLIQVDGGINLETIKKVAKLADNFIIGTSLMNIVGNERADFVKKISKEL